MPTPNHRKNGEFRRGHKAAQIGDEPAGADINLRVTARAKERWMRAATGNGLKLSAWMRENNDRAADEYERDAGIAPVSAPTHPRSRS